MKLHFVLHIIILLSKHSTSQSTCTNQINYIDESFSRNVPWARQLRDSWGRFPSGIFSGNHYDFGNFDQCINFIYKSEVVSEIRGQYCLLMFPYDLRMQTSNFQQRLAPKPFSYDINLGIGVCYPHTCVHDEIKVIANSTLKTLMNISIPNEYRPDLFCSVKRDSFRFNGLQITAISIFSFVLIMILSSTSYEIACNILNHSKHPLLSSFSVYSNSIAIMSMKPSSSKEMIFLHGIRSLAIIWIVISHTYITFMQLPVMNAYYYFEWIKNLSAMFIMSGAMNVDTFFLMSSMLLTLSVFNELDRSNRFNIPLLLIKRYLRITVPLSAAILFILTFFYYISDGPLWHMLITSSTLNQCQNYWWSTLLYVANYVNPGQLCFGHSWYLIVDMQLYFLSPIILYPLWRFRNYYKVTIPLIFLLSSSSVIYMYLTFYFHAFRISKFDGRSNERDMLTYYATQSRIDSWMMGILTGYILHSIQGKVLKISKIFKFSAWIFTITSMFGIIIGQHPLQQINFHQNLIHADAAYGAFQRIFWCLAVSWIIIACQQKIGGVVQKFLSLPIWLPVSKLSFCIYLIHLPIQLVYMSSMRLPQYFADARAVHIFMGDFIMAFFVAFVWSLMFEYPVLRIIKVLLESGIGK